MRGGGNWYGSKRRALLHYDRALPYCTTRFYHKDSIYSSVIWAPLGVRERAHESRVPAYSQTPNSRSWAIANFPSYLPVPLPERRLKAQKSIAFVL